MNNDNPGRELSSIDFQSMIGGPLSAVVDAQAQAALSSVNFIKSVGFTQDKKDENDNIVPGGDPIYVTFKYPKELQPYQPGVQGIIQSIKVKTAGSNYPANSSLDVTINGGNGATAIANTNDAGAITGISITNGGSGYDKSTATVVINADTGSGFVAGVIETTDKDAAAAVVQNMALEVPILTMLPIPFIRIEEASIDFHAKITSMSYLNTASNVSVSEGSVDIKNYTKSRHHKSGFFSFGNTNYNSRYSGSATLRTNLSYRSSTRNGNQVNKVFQLGVNVKVSQAEMPEGMEKLMGILEDSIVARPIEA